MNRTFPIRQLFVLIAKYRETFSHLSLRSGSSLDFVVFYKTINGIADRLNPSSVSFPYLLNVTHDFVAHCIRRIGCSIKEYDGEIPDAGSLQRGKR